MRWTSLWRAGLIGTVLVFCMGVFAGQAQAFRASSFSTSAYGVISSISVTPTSVTKAASTTWTVAFTTENAIPSAGGKIALNLNGASWTSDTFSSATLGSTTSPSGLSIASRYGNSIELSTSATIAAGTTFSLKLENVKNPSTGGSYFLKVNTTKYGEAIDGSANWNGDYLSPFFTIGTNTNFAGTVTDSASVASPFASVSIYSSDYSTYYYGYTDKNGQYGFGDVPAGTYTLYVYAPSSWNNGSTATVSRSPAPSSVTVASSGITTKNVSFSAATKTLTTTVKKADGTAVSGANVYVSSYSNGSSGYANAKSGSDGKATFTMPGGSWSLGIWADYGSDWIVCGTDSYRTTEFKDDATTESKAEAFSVTSLSSTVNGKVTKANGTAVGQYQASVSLQSSGGCWYSGSTDSSGNFSTKVSPSTYSVTGYSSDNTHSFPKIANFTVGDSETKDLGTIKLVEKTDTIAGTVKDNLGVVVAGASISAWRNDGTYDWANTTSATDGTYTLKVTPGKWQVSAWPSWSYTGSQEYLSTGDPQTVEVSSGVAATANFTFQKATNTITGTVTDEDGNTLTSLSGGIGASDGSKTWSQVWATVTNGTYSMKLPAGTWNLSLSTWGGDYSSGDAVSVTVTNNESKTVTLKALKNDVTVQGTIYDEDKNKVTGKWMSIYATKGQNASWRNATVDTAAGTYSIKVSAGKWKLGWWMDSTQGYASGSGQDIEIDAKAGETKTQDITLKKANATISGTAKKADGTAMQWAWITADNRDPNEKTEANNMFYSNGASSGTDGKFSLKVPAGTYWVGGSMWVGSGVINPQRQKVTVEKDQTASADLTFRESDASIDGTVKLDSSGTSSFVTAWSEDGAYAETSSSNVGAYKLAVTSGTTWHVRAIKESGQDIYKSSEVLVDLTGGKQASKDLELKKQVYTLPDNESFTFDPTVNQTFTLDDGSKVSIPANTVATSGTAILTVEPDANLAEEADAKPLAYGYDLGVTVDGQAVTNFSGNVTVESVYTAEQVDSANVLAENEMIIGYYDTSVSAWKELENCNVNPDSDTVTCQVDHFTKFAIIAASDTTPPGAPTGVTATDKATGGAISLGWTKPTDTDFASVTIYRSTASDQVGNVLKSGATGTSYDDTGLVDGTTYYYTLRAVDTSGNESTSVKVSTAPTNSGTATTTSVADDGTTTTAATAAATTTSLPKTGQPGQPGTMGTWLILLAIPGLLIGRAVLRRQRHGR
ncbi:carboxypeptidase regulatory-like domain-containing protein [Candidatus Berkelbacteria bacterium]|nr:carboxypeptidase regulatory-like domain-containing protein [Candidatus Berkelbacteria bacterium]